MAQNIAGRWVLSSIAVAPTLDIMSRTVFAHDAGAHDAHIQVMDVSAQAIRRVGGSWFSIHKIMKIISKITNHALKNDKQNKYSVSKL